MRERELMLLIDYDDFASLKWSLLNRERVQQRNAVDGALVSEWERDKE